MPTLDQIERLVALVEQGRFLDALQTFYDDAATMQENAASPRVGLANLLRHEQGVMASFKAIKGRRSGPIFVDGDHVVINWVFDFTTKDGRTLSLDELALQRWRDGKVVEERFYYDPAQMR